jgi:hypothetical protein
MESDKLYEKETGKSAWIIYAHAFGPTDKFLSWLDEAALKYYGTHAANNTTVPCPTCGGACTIEGDEKEGTHYYVPCR